ALPQQGRGRALEGAWADPALGRAAAGAGAAVGGGAAGHRGRGAGRGRGRGGVRGGGHLGAGGDPAARRVHGGATMSETSYREAVRAAIREALERDPRVFLMGEDVGAYGGCYAVTKGLLEEFGEERIRDTPLSESGFVGVGIGAALGGWRPIVEIMTCNFS